MTAITMLTAEAQSDTSRASKKPWTEIASGAMSATTRRITASRARMSRKPRATVNGSRRAATIGGRIALRTATTAATRTAPPNPLTLPPGTMPAAIRIATAEESQAKAMRNGRSRGRPGTHASCVPAVVTSGRLGRLGREPGAEELERAPRLRLLRARQVDPALGEECAGGDHDVEGVG